MQRNIRTFRSARAAFSGCVLAILDTCMAHTPAAVCSDVVESVGWAVTCEVFGIPCEGAYEGEA